MFDKEFGKLHVQLDNLKEVHNIDNSYLNFSVIFKDFGKQFAFVEFLYWNGFEAARSDCFLDYSWITEDLLDVD